MLSIEDIICLSEEDVRIVYRRKPHPEGFCGEYSAENREVNIYVNNISSQEEKNLTILHELYHAKKDIISCMEDEREEELAEKEAEKTLKQRPGVLEIAKKLMR